MTAATVARPWSAPDAILVLPADAPIPTWLEVRRLGLGGSDASTVAGVNHWSSPYALWLDKTGKARPREQTRQMQVGRLLEPIVRTLFLEDTGIPVRRAGLMRSRRWPHLQVSLDGLTGDGGIFESKVTGWRLAHEWSDDQVSDHAEVQVQHGLAVTGRSHAWVAALVDNRDLMVRRVERDDQLIENLVELELDFWRRHVEPDVAPPADARALTAIKDRWSDVALPFRDVDDTTWAAIRDEYRDAKQNVKEAAEDADAAEARLRELFADAEVLRVAGADVATCKPITQRRVDAKALRIDHPDLAAQYERASTYRRIYLKTIKKDGD